MVNSREPAGEGGVMGDEEEAATEGPPPGKPAAKAPVEDPRDDFRDRLIKHRAQMQRFFDSRLRGTVGRRPGR